MKFVEVKREYALKIKLFYSMLFIVLNIFGQNEKIKAEYRFKGSGVAFLGINRNTVSYLKQTFALNSNNTQMLKFSLDMKSGPVFVSSTYDYLLINYSSQNQQFEGRFQSFGVCFGPSLDLKRFRFDLGLIFKGIYGNINFKSTEGINSLDINTTIQNANYVKINPSFMYGLQSNFYYELYFKRRPLMILNKVKPMTNINLEYSMFNTNKTGMIDGNRLLDNYFNIGFGVSFLIGSVVD
jgi:hypothetical protein